MTTTSKTTTRTKLFLVMKKPYTYEWYGKHTYKVGYRQEINRRDLRDNGYCMIIGHGMNEIIPRDCFRLEKVTIKRTIIEEEEVVSID